MQKKISAHVLALVLVAAGCATQDVAAPGAMPASDVAGIVVAVHEGEVQQGSAARSRATSPEVRAFAEMMIADHGTALDRGHAAFARAGVTPSENDTTRLLRSGSQRTVTNLATYSGAAYDRTYVQAQVDAHRWVLHSIDTVLLPSTTNAELRTLLQTQRGSVVSHLERAQRILSAL